MDNELITTLLDSARNDRAPTSGSNLNFPFKNKFGRAGECDVAEAAVDRFETDLKFVTAPRDYVDRAAAFSVAAKMSALATIPVPHASVSFSTPRSYVRIAILLGSRFSMKFTFAPFGENIL